jgi:hypothetical protein
MRTISKPLARRRTSIVRFQEIGIGAIVVLMSLAADDAVGQSSTHRESSGWLQLKSDQRRYRERAEPLAPADDAYLGRLEERQVRELRGLQSEQRRERRLEERSRRMRKPEARVRVPFGEPEQQREVERQRLNQRIQREAFGAGRW